MTGENEFLDNKTSVMSESQWRDVIGRHENMGPIVQVGHEGEICTNALLMAQGVSADEWMEVCPMCEPLYWVPKM